MEGSSDLFVMDVLEITTMRLITLLFCSRLYLGNADIINLRCCMKISKHTPGSVPSLDILQHAPSRVYALCLLVLAMEANKWTLVIEGTKAEDCTAAFCVLEDTRTGEQPSKEELIHGIYDASLRILWSLTVGNMEIRSLIYMS